MDKKNINLRLWLLLTGTSAIGSLAVLPYSLQLTGQTLDTINQRMRERGRKPLTRGSLVALALLQSQVSFGLSSALGLWLGPRTGLGAPRLRAWLEGKTIDLTRQDVARYAAAGVGASLGIVLLDMTVFRKVSEEMAKKGLKEPGWWQGLLASIYGGIAEEVLARLGVMTAIAAGLRRLLGDRAKPSPAAVIWPAIIGSDLLFGAGHLPATRAVVPLTPMVVIRALVSNSVGGTVFGYLYWKEGLEAAMIAHSAADVVLHAGTPLLRKR